LGDSGSWVVNETTGEVYGHVILVDLLGEGYVVPIQSTLLNVKAQLGASHVVLPNTEDIFELKRIHNIQATATFEGESTLVSETIPPSVSVESAPGPVHPGPAAENCLGSVASWISDGIYKGGAKLMSISSVFISLAPSLLRRSLLPLEYPIGPYTGFTNFKLNETFYIEAEDGVKTRLHVWKPTRMLGQTTTGIRSIMMIHDVAVDHQMYALPSIQMNAVDYFTWAGYRVFIPVHRVGIRRAAHQWTVYDSRLDIKASLEYVREHYGEQQIYVIAHGLGSVALSCGLLDGKIPSEWIIGVTSSQTFMNPLPQHGAYLPRVLKMEIERLYQHLAGYWFNFAAGRNDGITHSFIDQLLRCRPDNSEEACNNATCHRLSAVLGRPWNHRNLNELTHRNIDRFVGGISLNTLRHFDKMAADGRVNTGGPSYDCLVRPDTIARLKGIPIFLIAGQDNAVIPTESSEMSYNTLVDHFKLEELHEDSSDVPMYRFKIIPGYGHLDCWMGENAWRDVYPIVRKEVDRVVRGSDYLFEELVTIEETHDFTSHIDYKDNMTSTDDAYNRTGHSRYTGGAKVESRLGGFCLR
jgi:pimeloyl-ACP methyl ester carboxylesterase